MQTLTEPKIIAGNSNMSLASAITRRMSMHRGKLLEVVDARTVSYTHLTLPTNREV